MLNPFADILELIYPNRCAACGGNVSESEGPICYSCRTDLPTVFSNPFSNHAELEKKFEGLLPIRHAIAFLKFSKGGPTQRLLHGLKYGQRPEIGSVLGKILGSQIRNAGFSGKFDLILPIPLHTKKLKLRGYNQAMKLAEGLAHSFDSHADDSTLIRMKATETQTRKGKLERILNVREVFGISPDKLKYLSGKHILLVDDVITTGSTMEACGRVLMEENPASLSIATLALAGKI